MIQQAQLGRQISQPLMMQSIPTIIPPNRQIFNQPQQLIQQSPINYNQVSPLNYNHIQPQIQVPPQTYSPGRVAFPIDSELTIERERNRLLLKQNHELQTQILLHSTQQKVVNTPLGSPMGQDGNVLRMENEKLSFAYVDKQRELDFLQEKIQIVTVELDNITKLYQQRCQEIDKKDNTISHLEKSKVDWQQQEGKLKIKIAELEQQSQGLKIINAQQSKKAESNLQLKANQLVAENTKINNILNARLKEVQALNNRITVMTQENQSLLFKVQNMQVERDKYATAIDTLKNDHEQLYLDNEKLSNAYVELRQQRFQEPRSDLIHLQAADNPELNYLREQVRALEQERNDLHRMRQDRSPIQMDAELIRLRRDNEDQRHKLQMMSNNQNTSEAMRRNNDDLKFEIDSLRRKLQNLDEENDQLRQKLKQGDHNNEENKTQLKREHEQTISQLQKKIRELDSHDGGEELTHMRRRLHDIEEALRIADRQNLELMSKIDNQNGGTNYHNELERQLEEKQQQINQLKTKQLKTSEQYLLLGVENDRLHQIVDELQKEIQLILSRQTSYDNVLQHQKEDVRAQVERELDLKLSRQYQENQSYVERLMGHTKDLEGRLHASEDERQKLLRHLNGGMRNDNDPKMQDALKNYEQEIHYLQQEQKELVFQLTNMQSENDRLNQVIMDRFREYRR